MRPKGDSSNQGPLSNRACRFPAHGLPVIGRRAALWSLRPEGSLRVTDRTAGTLPSHRLIRHGVRSSRSLQSPPYYDPLGLPLHGARLRHRLHFMLRPACLLPATQLSSPRRLLTPRSGLRISPHAWGLLSGAPMLTGVGLAPTGEAQQVMNPSAQHAACLSTTSRRTT
jgi:hypothetical protein